MNAFRRIVPAHLRFLVAIHVILLGIFSIFRGITLLYNRPSYFFSMDRSLSLMEAFQIGLWFDITVATYALLVPYLLLTLAYFRPREYQRMFAFVRIYCGAVLLVSLVICAADIPYFNFFNSRLTTAAVHWKNNIQVAKFIFTQIEYYPFILIFAAGIWSVGKLIRQLWHQTWVRTYAHHNGRNKALATGMASLLILCGLWGGATPKAPDMKRAWFSNDGFINQLTLNPVHTWFDSYFDFKVNIHTIGAALSKAQRELGVGDQQYASPLAHEHRYAQQARPMNVVLVLLESMSADRMGIYGDPANLTPYLDSLARTSVFFDNCYSNGIHTNAGLYSSLYGMPIMMMQHPMYNGVSEYTQFTGLPVTLREKGYQTQFFCTHPKSFDNLDVFLEKNGYDRISDVNDYPQDRVANSWGVGDESLYEHALNTMDSLASDPDGKPFFTTILTITTHPPFTLPAFTKFKPTRTDPIEITYEYADWAVKQFMQNCAQKSWYDNTLFVFVGDHGVNLPTKLDVPLSYNHVPLIFHAPALFNKPEVKHQLANQTDIYPTVMGLLRRDYVQNTMGYDLFREKRPFVLFSQDHKLGVLNEQFLFVARKSGRETLFDYRSGSTTDLSLIHPTLADSMKNYACTQLQVAQWMIENKHTGTPTRIEKKPLSK